MANTLSPFGFIPVRRVDGAAWTGNQTVRKIASNNTNKIFKGDLVVSLTSGYIDVASASSQAAGVFVGCKYLSTAFQRVIWSPYYPGADAAADVEAYIIDDPLCVFVAQSGGGSGSPLALANIGNTIKITTATAGNTSNGISGMALDDNNVSNSAGTTFPFRIVDAPGVQVANINGIGVPPGAFQNGYDPLTKYNVAYVMFNAQDLRLTSGV